MATWVGRRGRPPVRDLYRELGVGLVSCAQILGVGVSSGRLSLRETVPTRTLKCTSVNGDIQAAGDLGRLETTYRIRCRVPHVYPFKGPVPGFLPP